MDEAQPGDLIFHYSQGFVRGVSTVLGDARDALRPYAADEWTN
jgi:hypothetical protein